MPGITLFNCGVLIATPGAPRADIRALRDIRFVMKDGEVIRNQLEQTEPA